VLPVSAASECVDQSFKVPLGALLNGHQRPNVPASFNNQLHAFTDKASNGCDLSVVLIQAFFRSHASPQAGIFIVAEWNNSLAFDVSRWEGGGLLR